MSYKLQVPFFGLVIVFLVNHVCSLSLRDNVKKMEMLDIARIAISYKHQNKHPDSDVNQWFANRKFGSLKLISTPKLVQTFNWKKCDHSPSLFNLSALTLSPDPLLFPGQISVQFAGALKETVDAPLKVEVILKKEITAAFWLEVPCIEGIGSCTYDDICETLQGAVCPKAFVKYSIPCKCPFPKGSYKMLNSSFNVDVNEVPSGSYYLQANVSYGTKQVTCLDIHFSIGEK